MIDTFPAKEVSDRWRVTMRTIRNWRDRHGDAVVADDGKLARALLNEPKTPYDVRERARAFISGEEMTGAGELAVQAIADMPALAKETERHLAAINDELWRCRKSGDKGGEVAQAKLYKEMAASLIGIRRTQALIGQDAGELLARNEAVRIIYTFASRAAIGIQRLRDKLAPKVVGLTDESEVVRIIDDLAITELFLAPFARAVNVAAECALPEWVNDTIKDGVSITIQDGEQELEKEIECLTDTQETGASSHTEGAESNTGTE